MHAVKHLPEQRAARVPEKPGGKDIHGAVVRVAEYLRDQRERFFPGSRRLDSAHRSVMAPFFSPGLLDAVGIVELAGCRLENPAFHAEARDRGFSSLPDFQHLASFTFVDVVVFQERPTNRILFHGLVHAAQVQLLGVERYADLFVRSLARVHSHFLVPLEAHAFSLDARFALNAGRPFSVEEEIQAWIRDRRYLSS